MSPAKRLSRQRFRALCERCRAWDDRHTPMTRREMRRTARFYRSLVDAASGTPDERWTEAEQRFWRLGIGRRLAR